MASRKAVSSEVTNNNHKVPLKAASQPRSPEQALSGLGGFQLQAELEPQLSLITLEEFTCGARPRLQQRPALTACDLSVPRAQ